MTKPVRVLFVCSGNICRSPMAEAVFQHMVDEAGLSEKIRVDSAGTGSWHVGEPPHRGTQAVLKREGIAYEGRARQLRRADLDEFDYVLVMDRSHLADIRRLTGASHSHVNMFLRFARDAGTVREEEVPDPYYDGGFDHVYDLVRKGCEALLQHLRREHRI